MASNPVANANIANFIPQVWSLKVKADVENALVCANLADRQYEADLRFGDRVNVPNLADLGTPSAVSLTGDITLADTIMNVDAIIANNWFEKAIGYTKMHRIQNRPDFLEKAMRKIGYSLAKKIDTSVNELFNSFTNTVGTEGSPITLNTLLTGIEYLNVNDAPDEGRVIIIDPESMTDFLKIEEFVSNLYKDKEGITRGKISHVLNCDVYMTNNLEAVNTTYHGAAIMQKEAIALVMQQSPDVEKFYWDERKTHVISVDAVWGVKIMRDAFGVFLKTRS